MELKERNILIWLSHIEGISNKDIEKLIKYFNTLDELWTADVRHIKNALGNRGIIIEKIIKNRNREFFSKVFKNIDKYVIECLTIYDENYPEKLRNIYDPPYVIYMKGNKEYLNIPLIAIVGARKCTAYGKWAAYQFSKELAQWGIGTISGLALGIDTNSHKGALDGTGNTVGVLGCGLDQCYPASNERLMSTMIENGCVLSEYPLGMPPLKHHFPTRNRIISALSDGVIVIEASEKSGALITVEYALDQGKDIYALPGNINSLQSKGTNRLIRDGAKILLDIEDVIESLKYRYSISKKQIEKSTQEELSPLEKRVYEIIRRNPIHIDLLYNETRLHPWELNPILTILEIKGYIIQISGKTFTVPK